MKKLLLTIFFCLLLPINLYAQQYENFPFNFRIDLPDDWEQSINDKTYFPILKYKEYTEETGVITIYGGHPTQDISIDMPDSFKNLSQEKMDYIVDVFITKLHETYGNIRLTYSKNVIINDKRAIVLAYSFVIDKDGETIKTNGFWVAFIEDSLLYSFKLHTQDSTGKHQQVFFAMCESFEFLH